MHLELHCSLVKRYISDEKSTSKILACRISTAGIVKGRSPNKIIFKSLKSSLYEDCSDSTQALKIITWRVTLEAWPMRFYRTWKIP